MYLGTLHACTHREENVVLKANAISPVVLLLEMGGTETLHVPIGSLWHTLDDPVAIDVSIGEMGSRSGGSITIAWSDQFAVQVVHRLNELAEAFDEGRSWLVVIYEDSTNQRE